MENATSRVLEAGDLWKKLSQGEQCQIIDVREPGEYRSERIAGAVLIPLSELEKKAENIERDKPAYLLCKTGKRAQRAAARLADLGIDRTYVVQGGLQAWEQAGYPVFRPSGGVWSMERQVRFTAALLVLIGIALSYTMNANWICLSVFVALGMIVSAVTNSCGMAVLLMRMPWNQVQASHQNTSNQPN